MDSQREPEDIESVTFQRSELLEQIIASIGMTLYDALLQARRYDEVIALREIIGEFALLASVYGEQTSHVPEDLGISMSEAAQMKLRAIQYGTESTEWVYYAEDARKALTRLSEKLSDRAL